MESMLPLIEIAVFTSMVAMTPRFLTLTLVLMEIVVFLFRTLTMLIYHRSLQLVMVTKPLMMKSVKLEVLLFLIQTLFLLIILLFPIIMEVFLF